MTTNVEIYKPTLTDVIVKLDKISGKVEELSGEVDKLATEQERFNDRFSSYQQATRWIVQLAFTLIASANLTVIITAVFRR